MDQIKHNFINVQGLNLHVAETGTGPNTVVFLHGFPEIWYSWRHQMVAVAKAGFRAIAPDYRGYGLSDPPPQPEKASYKDIIADLLAISDALGLAKVFLIAKDFGARPAYLFALLHPERVSGVITLGVPFVPPGPYQYHNYLPEGFYISRWGEPGRAEADFGRLDAKTVVRNVYILFSRSDIPIAAENQEIMDLVDASTPLPPWFTEEDLATYGALYEKSGFQTALKIPYRSMDENFDIAEPIVKVPALFIMGDKDYVLKFPGMEEYIRSGKVKDFVPDLEILHLPEGSHFVQEQSPGQVNQLILAFLHKHFCLKKTVDSPLSHCLKMDQIQHKFITVQGLNVHVAETGTGPNTVVFLHGFPEIWYSWRHQMVAVAKAGFRAIAPDYRGYGLSDPPPQPEKASYKDIIADLLAIFDALGLAKVFLIAKDFGIRTAYLFALLHPERVSRIITLGAPLIPTGPLHLSPFPKASTYQDGRQQQCDVSYIFNPSMFEQEPGRAEADFGRLDAKTVVRNIYILFSRSDVPIAAENQEIMDLVDASTPLPPWFTEEDLATYGALYEKSGFQTALQVPYRSVDEKFNIAEPIVKVPALCIISDKDFALKFPGREEYMRSGKVKDSVPYLETIRLPEGTHFVQEQFPQQVNQLFLAFLNKHV
ncbi:hypothetical protein Ddye_019307 [Dipteronia dyeriana]|uniref:AB hydrolase-1 domain-containing protein n=1 Tax=Dipteronia dyeriana TaxID=168575 RepID=A0AAD9TY34_9ROSI|nr:hypothetical protein Ddye_019307 [Dipteronia dyeriana]